MSSHGPHFLFTISSILLSKNKHLDFVTVLLKSFQFSRLYIRWYLLSECWQSSFYQALEYLVILTSFEYTCHVSLILDERNWTTSSKDSMFQMDEVFKFLITWIRFLMNCFSSSLLFTSDHHVYKILSLWMEMLTVIGAWSDESLHSRWIWWWLISREEEQRNTKSKTKLAL